MNEYPIIHNILALADPTIWQSSIDLAEQALSAWKPRMMRRVILTGHGSSLFNSMVGETIIEHIARIPAKAVPSFALAAYPEPALLGPETLVVGISTTGETQSACAALAAARAAGASTLAVTAHPGTPITKDADMTLLTGGTDDRTSVKTRSYVQALVSLYVLAIHLAESRATTSPDLRAYWLGQIALARQGARQFLEGQRGEVEALAEAFAQQAPKVFVFGTGPNLGTAEEASLKIIEMAKMYSEAQELEEFFHGRLREVDATSPLLFVAPQGRASRRVLDFLTVTDQIQVPTVVLTDDITPGIQRLATRVIHLPVHLDEYATPLLYIVPLHLFSYEMALFRGYDPDARRYNLVPQNVRYADEETK